MHKNNTNKNMGLIVVVLVLAAGGFYLYSNPPEVPPGTPPTPPVVVVEPQPPIQTTPQGYVSGPSERGEVFRVSTSGVGPRLIEGFIDPYENPKIGDMQLLSIYAVDPVAVNSVSVTLTTDNKSSTYVLNLVKGTNMDGHWQGSWRFDDTRQNKYSIMISAKNDKGVSVVEIIP